MFKENVICPLSSVEKMIFVISFTTAQTWRLPWRLWDSVTVSVWISLNGFLLSMQFLMVWILFVICLLRFSGVWTWGQMCGAPGFSCYPGEIALHWMGEEDALVIHGDCRGWAQFSSYLTAKLALCAHNRMWELKLPYQLPKTLSAKWMMDSLIK